MKTRLEPATDEMEFTQVDAIRCLRRKLQRVLKCYLSNEEVAVYWTQSCYSRYYIKRMREVA